MNHKEFIENRLEFQSSQLREQVETISSMFSRAVDDLRFEVNRILDFDPEKPTANISATERMSWAVNSLLGVSANIHVEKLMVRAKELDDLRRYLLDADDEEKE